MFQGNHLVGHEVTGADLPRGLPAGCLFYLFGYSPSVFAAPPTVTACQAVFDYVNGTAVIAP